MINKLTIDGFEIQTWKAQTLSDDQFLAVNMTESIKFLEGSDLTDEEKIDVTELLAGYCRLLDERHLCGYGDTEFDAIVNLFFLSKNRSDKK